MLLLFSLAGLCTYLAVSPAQIIMQLFCCLSLKIEIGCIYETFRWELFLNTINGPHLKWDDRNIHCTKRLTRGHLMFFWGFVSRHPAHDKMYKLLSRDFLEVYWQKVLPDVCGNYFWFWIFIRRTNVHIDYTVIVQSDCICMGSMMTRWRGHTVVCSLV